MHENHAGIRNPSKVLARPLSLNVIENIRFTDKVYWFIDTFQYIAANRGWYSTKREYQHLFVRLLRYSHLFVWLLLFCVYYSFFHALQYIEQIFVVGEEKNRNHRWTLWSKFSFFFVFCFFFLLSSLFNICGGGGPHLTACRILVPGPGIELPGFLAVKALSPNYWTNREFLSFNSWSQ